MQQVAIGHPMSGAKKVHFIARVQNEQYSTVCCALHVQQHYLLCIKSAASALLNTNQCILFSLVPSRESPLKSPHETCATALTGHQLQDTAQRCLMSDACALRIRR